MRQRKYKKGGHRARRLDIDKIIGTKHKMLTILGLADTPVGVDLRVVAKCECGNIKSYSYYAMSRGGTISCGCYRKRKGRNGQHLLSNTRIYKIWGGLRNRCNNKNNRNYKNYGGRGIKICKEWGNFINFYNWAINNGYKNSLSIDRIDVNCDYTPFNCRWVDIKTQSRNKRHTNKLIFEGRERLLVELLEEIGIKSSTYYQRIYAYGWDVERALKTPVKK